jgi:hypothetical protein
MKGRVIVALAIIASVVGCGDDGPDTEAGRQHAAIVAKLKAVDPGIQSTTDVSAAIKKYEVANTEIQAIIEKFPNSDEAEELTQILKWLEEEVARLKVIQEANQPPPTIPPGFYQ